MTWMINIRNEIGANMTDPTAIKTIGEYYTQQHAKIWQLKRNKFLKELNQDDINNLNSPVAIKKFEL